MPTDFFKLDPERYPLRYIVTAGTNDAAYYESLVKACRNRGIGDGGEFETDNLFVRFDSSDNDRIVIHYGDGEQGDHLLMGRIDSAHLYRATTSPEWYAFFFLMHTPSTENSNFAS